MFTAIKLARTTLIAVATLMVVLYVFLAFASRKMPDLLAEHQIEFEAEFRAADENDTDWPAYLAIDEALAGELGRKIDPDTRPDSLVDRYSADSMTAPSNYDADWNRSYELSAPNPRGVAVLLHGLTDSPYSMLSTAETLVAAGYNVVVPRIPGHGFAVGGLLQARWEDWTAAVRIAVRHAVTKTAGDDSLLLVGYSNGGLLAIDFALRCDEIDMPCPDGIVLMSPAIAVTRLAMVTNLHKGVSWMPAFEKFQWQTVLPEVDPFKFTSFPNQAAWEIHRVSRRMHRELERPNEVAKLPPILTFQSAVDNTVSAEAIVRLLYNWLPANGSRLVVYDINRKSTLQHLMRNRTPDPVAAFEALAPFSFDLSIVRNRSPATLTVDAWNLPAGETEADIVETSLRWPTDSFSLSHIAIPFRVDDKVYGDGSGVDGDDTGVVFGNLSPRGESGVLRLSPSYFLRMRYNPFFAFQQSVLIAWLEDL